MSYDITFWKAKPSASPDPQATYERLNRNDPPDELEELPLPEVIERLREAFPDFDPTAEFPDAAVDGGSVEISYTARSFRFDFRPPTAPGKGKVWRIMNRFGCACYDPQTGKLHAPDDPPPFADRDDDGAPDLRWMLDAARLDSVAKAGGGFRGALHRATLAVVPRLLVVLFVISAILAAIITGFVYLIRGIASLFSALIC